MIGDLSAGVVLQNLVAKYLSDTIGETRVCEGENGRIDVYSAGTRRKVTEPKAVGGNGA